MTPEEIFHKLERELGPECVFNFDAGTGKAKDAFCEVEPGSITRVAQLMKADPALGFDYLECITGIDFPNDQKIQVVYHVYSYGKKHRLVLKVSLVRDDPVIASLCSVWSAANWLERECFDLLGVLFEGHPDLRRLLLPDDWEGYPLRKDWKEKPDYHGIPSTRPNPFDLLAKAKALEAKKAAEAKGAEPADGKPTKVVEVNAAAAEPAADAEAKKAAAKAAAIAKAAAKKAAAKKGSP